MNYYPHQVNKIARPFGAHNGRLIELSRELQDEHWITTPDNYKSDSINLQSVNATMYAKLMLAFGNYYPEVYPGNTRIVYCIDQDLSRLSELSNTLTANLVLDSGDGGYVLSTLNPSMAATLFHNEPMKTDLWSGMAFVMDADCWHSIRPKRKCEDKPLVILQTDLRYRNSVDRYEIIDRIVKMAESRMTEHPPAQINVVDTNIPKEYPPAIA